MKNFIFLKFLRRFYLFVAILCISSLGAFAQLSWAGSYTFTSNTTISQNINLTDGVYIGVDNGVTVTISGVISCSAPTCILYKIGGGTLILNGNNTYTSVTDISMGTLALGANGSISSSSKVVLYGPVIFDISASSNAKTVKNLEGSASAELKLGANRLQIGTSKTSNDGGGTYAGKITGTGSSYVIDKYGTQTLELTGTSTYSGYTDINSGTISFNSLSNFGSSTVRLYGGTLSWASGCTADISSKLIVQSDGGTLDVGANSVTFASALTSSNINGPITKTGSGELRFTGANTYTALTTVSSGNLCIGNNGTTGSHTGDIALASSSAFLYFLRSNNSTYSGVISGTGNVIKNSSGTMVLTNTSTYSGATTINAGTLQLGDGSANVNLTNTSGISVSSGAKFHLQTSTGSNLNFSRNISGAGNMEFTGTTTGTYYTGNNTLTGTTTITAGSLSIGNGGTSGSITGNIIQNSSSELNFFRNNDYTYSGVISGTGSVAQSGSGNLTLNGANTYSGSTNIWNGTLILGANGSIENSSGVQFLGNTIFSISGAKTIKRLNSGSSYTTSRVNLNSYTLQIGTTGNADGNGTYYGYFTGATGAIRKRGTGTLTLTNTTTNNTQGYTYLYEGTIAFNSLNNFGTSGVIQLYGNGTLQWNADNIDISSKITHIASGAEVRLNTNSYIVTLATALTTSNSTNYDLIKLGDGNLFLNATQAYTGATTLSDGALVLGANGHIATSSGLTITSGSGIFDITAGTAIKTIKSLNSTNTAARVNLGGNTLKIGTSGGSDGGGTYAGYFTGTSASTHLAIDKHGSATLTLTSTSSSNTYTGYFDINDGTVIFSNLNAFGAANIRFYENNSVLQWASGNTADISSKIYYINVSARFNTNGNNVTFATALPTSTNANYAITKQGTGTLTLNATQNYTGITNINGGTLALGASGHIANSSGVQFASTGTGLIFDISAGSKTIKNLNSSNSSTRVHLGTYALNIGTNLTSSDGSGTYAGYITGSATGTNTAIRKYGTGTLTLANTTLGGASSATTNNYTGDTEICSGAIVFNSLNNFGNSRIYLAGGTLRWAAGNSADITATGRFYASYGTLDVQNNNVVFENAINGNSSNGFTKAGSGVLIIAYNNTAYTGKVVVAEGFLNIGNGSAVTATGALNSDIELSSGATLQFTRGNEYTYSKVISSTTTGSGYIDQYHGTTILTGANTFTGAINVVSGVLQIGNGTSGSIVSTANTSYGAVTTNTAATLRFYPLGDLTFAREIGGGGNVEKIGPGRLAFTGNNTYNGSTTINEGDLYIGNIPGNSTTGAITGNISVASGAFLVFARGNSYNYGGVISGEGTVRQFGDGTVTLTGVNTYTGTTNIPYGGVTLSSTGTIANSAGVTLTGSSTFTIQGAKTIQALTNATGNTVALGSYYLTIGTTGENNGNGTCNGIFTGTGAVSKRGAGTLVIASGSNTASGTFNQYEGTVQMNNGAKWAGGYTKSSGTTLTVNGSVNIGGALNLNGGDINMNLTTSPASKITVGGALSKTGANTLNITATGTITNADLIQAASGVTTSNFTANMPGYTPVLSAVGSTILRLNAAAFVPVTNITGLPTAATLGAPLTLTGTVVPSDATNKTITWSISNANGTGATITGGNIFNATATGTATLTATIANGLASGNYTQNFDITVSKGTLSGTVSITGSAIFGETLTANTTALTSTPVVTLGTLTYQWKRGTTNIGTNSTTYTLVQADIGSTITLTVTAANCTGSVTSAATATVTKATQTAPAAPTLLSKTTTSITLNAMAGCEFSRDGGAWQTSTTFSGLTANTSYSFTARMAETASHLASSASAVLTVVTDDNPTLSGTVSITGSAIFGETLSANTTALTSTPSVTLGTLTYQWKRGSTNIGTNSSTYTLVLADIGSTITVTVTAANCTGSVTSPATATVTKATQTAPAAPTLLSKTTTSITLNTMAGCEFSRDGGAWQTSTTFSGLTANTSYSFTARKAETATHLASSASAVFTVVTDDNPTLAGTVSITGSAIFGETLTANTTALTSTPSVALGTLTYQWKRGSTNIGTNSSTYTLVLADIGSTITVTVTAANCTGSVTSPATVTVTKATQTAPSAPTLLSKTTTSITLNAMAGCEFSRDGGAWQTATTFSGLTANTSYSFTARMAETATHLASAASTAASFSTSNATLSGTVTITGSAIFGETLTANTTALTSTPSVTLGTLTYQWKRGSTNIGTNSSTYTLVLADIGSTITVTVTAANCTGSVTSPATATVTKATQTAPAAPTLLSKTTTSITLNAMG